MFNGTPSQGPIKMNLQLFAEGDPIIDPTPAPVDPTPTDPTPPQDPGPVDPTPQPQDLDFTPFLEKIGEKAKFNHQPRKPESIDEVITNYQMGLNYPKLQERLQQLESHPALSWAEQQAKMYGFQTVEQYIEAVNQQQEQARLNELVQQNIPEEYAKEMLENRKFREQYEAQQRQQKEQQRQQQDFQTFLETYPDIKPDTIPPEVWMEHQKGRSLVDAYRSHENQILRQKVAEFEQKMQIQQVNTQNAQSSTGSLTGQGNVPSDFISKETFEQNRNNQSWMSKNYDHLVKSMKKW